MREIIKGVPVYEDRMDLMAYVDQDGVRKPVQSLSDWQIRRAHILKAMELVMGPLPPESRAVDRDVQVKDQAVLEGCLRWRITYAPEAGDRVPAYLFIPTSVEQAVPAVLCLHQTTDIGKGEPAGLGGKPNLHYAEELSERGLVTMAPDYPTFGDYQIDVYDRGYASATMKGIYNHMRALDLLQSLPEVAADRLGCIGHSLGGHNTLFLAAFDERVKVAVTSCGFNAFTHYHEGDISSWSHDGYMPRINEHFEGRAERMPFDFGEILAAIAPRAVFINAPQRDEPFTMEGAEVCIEAARPVFKLLGVGDKLMAEHPGCAHDFPPEVRERAYDFIERMLAD